MKYRGFILEFNDYYLVDSVISYLENIDLVSFKYFAHEPGIVSVMEQYNDKESMIIVIPNPANNKISIIFKDEIQYISDKLIIYNLYGMRLI